MYHIIFVFNEHVDHAHIRPRDNDILFVFGLRLSILHTIWLNGRNSLYLSIK